jgi:hydroxyethylthiazole kinase
VAKINTQIAEALARIREKQPLIHHITNTVAIADTANLTLHLGALPIMATAAEEAAEMTAQASALVLNIGTLSSALVQSMLLAGLKANWAFPSCSIRWEPAPRGCAPTPASACSMSWA